jgi:hypothetical protein
VSGEQPRDVDPVEDATFVRPFIITGGRSEPLQADLRLETLVVTVGGAGEPLVLERQQIVALCERPTTVAEIADAVGVPLGVARVLISDLIVSGRLACQQPAELPLHTLERIRDHVRAL